MGEERGEGLPVGKELKNLHLTPTLSHRRGSKCAFTLAETLITLVIVGVIAAITIPTIIAKYQEEQLKTQFKKAYSTISNALNKTVMLDFSGSVDCFYGQNGETSRKSNDCASFWQYFTKNMSLSRVCNKNAKSGGCIPKYSVYADDGVGCGGYSESSLNNNATVYVLSSGQIIIPYAYQDESLPLFMVDINGFKGPNKPGFDLFGFNITKRPNSNLFIYSGICVPTETNGKTTLQMMKYALAGKEN